MKKVYKNSVFVFSLAWLIMAVSGCTDSTVEPEKPTYLLKTAHITVTSSDFEAALDLKRAAYPYNINENADEYNEMVIHLVEILSEKIVLLSEAAQQNIVIPDAQIQAAEQEFKADYPEDSFEKMLLTNAIPYAFWKKRFVQDLIIEQLISQSLEGKIEIKADDIVAFYDRVKQNQDSGQPNKPDTADIDETQLISRLRMQKTQEYYAKWLKSLWEKHPVELNKAVLRTFLIDTEPVKED